MQPPIWITKFPGPTLSRNIDPVARPTIEMLQVLGHQPANLTLHINTERVGFNEAKFTENIPNIFIEFMKFAKLLDLAFWYYNLRIRN